MTRFAANCCRVAILTACSITGIPILWLFCQHHQLLTKMFYIHSSCKHELGKNPGLSPAALMLADIKGLWCSGKKSKLWKREHCCLSEGKPMLKEKHPCSKNFVRQMSTTTLYALGILWVILDSRCLFQGMFPHQES